MTPRKVIAFFRRPAYPEIAIRHAMEAALTTVVAEKGRGRRG